MLEQKIQVLGQNLENLLFLDFYHSMITDHDRKLCIEVEMNQMYHVIFRSFVCIVKFVHFFKNAYKLKLGKTIYK